MRSVAWLDKRGFSYFNTVDFFYIISTHELYCLKLYLFIWFASDDGLHYLRLSIFQNTKRLTVVSKLSFDSDSMKSKRTKGMGGDKNKLMGTKECVFSTLLCLCVGLYPVSSIMQPVHKLAQPHSSARGEQNTH